MRTLEDINAELEQVRQKLDRARKLSAVMEDLKAQHEERKRAAEDALKVLYREQEDVEELERLSFASFLARIRGEQAERLDQERREAVAAKARYDAARRDLEDLEARFQAAQKERAGLEGLRGRWKALMEEKEELLCQAGGERAKRLIQIGCDLDSLGAQIRELDERLSHLRTMKKTLVSRHQDMMALLHLDLSEISVVQKEKSCLAVVPVEQELPTAADVEQVIGAVKRYSLQRLHDAVYGSMIAVDQLHQGSYGRYEALYVELPRLSTQKGLHIRPGGQYLRAFCKGSWDNLPGRYEEILAYARAHGLELYGYSYETGINESVINGFDEYITQIEIPIQI